MSNMLDFTLRTPEDLRKIIATNARERRLFYNITQKELADRTGVSLGSIKRFEKTGLISLSSLLEIALVLNCMDAFATLFPQPELETSLYKLPKKRQRSSGHAAKKS